MNHPLDLYSLHLVRKIAEHRSFSEAAREEGISQSALSRQIANVESRLGIRLFERTTRQVTITEAGAILLRDTASIPNILAGALRRIKEECLEAPPEVKVVLSTELSLAHIPGIFHPREDDTRIIVSQATPADLTRQLCEARFDIGIFASPAELPSGLKITHRMNDDFSLIAPTSITGPHDYPSWAAAQRWILPPKNSPARVLIEKSHHPCEAAMELENFDLMVQFVALGMGCAFVPRRSLSSFNRKAQIQKIPHPTKIQRELIAATPLDLKPSEQTEAFIQRILFS